MKIAAVKKFTQVLVAMAVAAVMAALLCAPKALGTTIGEFSIEQIYVNVPELDVFVQATDAQGQLISPDLVRAAGVELYLGMKRSPPVTSAWRTSRSAMYWRWTAVWTKPR